jgi:virulence-associated protein VapD
MSPEKDAYLCEKYPEIFVNRNGDIKESCMAWGFEINDGWFYIIDNACSLIQSHIKWKNQQREKAIKFNQSVEKAKNGDMDDLYDALFIKHPDDINSWQQEQMDEALAGNLREVPDFVEQLTADQIKEKFGTLRFYVTGGDEYTDGVVRMAEAMSGVTCETCGKPGKTGGKGWIRTTCEEHSK